MKNRLPVYFENLDGLRFFCFLSVFFFHSFHTEHTYIRDSEVYSLIKWGIFKNGNLGVNFFFVLSGFLITFLLIQEKTLNARINIINFWTRRMLRIWPLFYFCVLFGFLIFPLLKSLFGQLPQESANPVYYLLFINNFDFIEKGLPDASILGVLWSVAIEEQFYLVWPVLLAIFPLNAYKYLFSGLLLISLAFRGLYDDPTLNEHHTLSCMGDMIIGAFGALFIQRESFKRKVENLPKVFCLVLYALVLFIFLYRHELLSQNFFIRVVERPIIAIVFILVILEQSYTKSSFYKMSNSILISQLGLVTYGLYCLHFIGILITTTVTGKFGLNTTIWEVMVLETFCALSITIVLAKMSLKYFEGPFLSLKKKFSPVTTAHITD